MALVYESDGKFEFMRSAADISHLKDYQDVKGQVGAKRALEIAAAGRHNMLMVGPPGSGKSMLAERLPSIMPPLEFPRSNRIDQAFLVWPDCSLIAPRL